MKKASVGFAVFLLVSSSGAAFAQTQRTSASRAPASYRAKIDESTRQILAREYDAAIGTLQGAIEEDPSRPDAYYLTAEAQRLKGSNQEAITSFRATVQRASQSDDPLHEARGLHGIASTLEITQAPTGVVRQAWVELADFSDRNRNVSHPEVARARMRALDAIQELDQASEQVKQRIAERVTELAQEEQNRANAQRQGAAATPRQTAAERRAARRNQGAAAAPAVPEGPTSDTPAVGSEPPPRGATKAPAKRARRPASTDDAASTPATPTPTPAPAQAPTKQP